jgi:hypothetical protein
MLHPIFMQFLIIIMTIKCGIMNLCGIIYSMAEMLSICVSLYIYLLLKICFYIYLGPVVWSPIVRQMRSGTIFPCPSGGQENVRQHIKSSAHLSGA